MASTTTLVIDAFIGLIPVMGGALIGILVGLASKSYAHRLSVRDTARLERKSKLEAMVTQLFEINVWVQKMNNYHLFGGNEVLEPSPIAKIQALEALYFPELTEEVKELSILYMDYLSWLIQGAQLRVAAGDCIPPSEHMDKSSEVHKPLCKSWLVIVKKAKELGASLQTT